MNAAAGTLEIATTTTGTGGGEAVLTGLITQAGQRDTAAFETLVEQYKSLVCSITLAILRDVEASEEVAQDVFVAAWQRLRQLRNPQSFLPWLRQIARNRAHDFQRKQGRNRRRTVPIDAISETAAPSTDPRTNLQRAEEVAVLRAALEELPEETREIITLYYREGQSVRQVATLLDMSQDAVKQRLSRGRTKLKSDMESRFAEQLVRSSPSTGFTAAVLGAIAFAAPVSASAAAIGTAGKVAPAVATGIWVGLFAGLLCGAVAVWGGTRKQLARAWDDEERRGIRIGAVLQCISILGFLGFIACWNMLMDTPLKTHPKLVLGLIAAYWLAMNSVYFWNRRVTRRRREIQRVEEPEVWRKEQWDTWFGAAISITVLVLMMVGFGMALYLRQH